ncbi:MAG: hypothetical protein HYR89_04555, partial [Actinobacteria bacterium]|nr:hypothetical protein [Actinomycetota bacterium]
EAEKAWAEYYAEYGDGTEVPAGSDPTEVVEVAEGEVAVEAQAVVAAEEPPVE